MRVVRLRKKCMVRGCGNLETYAISRGWSEIGNVFICERCLKDALDKVVEARKKKEQTAKAVDEKVDEIEKSVDADETVEDVITETKCICTECGKEFDTVKGLTSHIARVHKE